MGAGLEVSEEKWANPIDFSSFWDGVATIVFLQVCLSMAAALFFALRALVRSTIEQRRQRRERERRMAEVVLLQVPLIDPASPVAPQQAPAVVYPVAVPELPAGYVYAVAVPERVIPMDDDL